MTATEMQPYSDTVKMLRQNLVSLEQECNNARNDCAKLKRQLDAYKKAFEEFEASEGREEGAKLRQLLNYYLGT